MFLEKPSPMVDSLLSPESGDIPSVSSSSPNRRRYNKLRNISIVEEEDERDSADEGIKMIPLDPANKVLSHHSSTSSLADKPLVVGSPKSHALDIGVLAAGLRSQLSMTGGVGGGDTTPGANPPTPFPVSSQIGTGGLSRQGSLRRVDGGPASASPASDRKSIPSSPSTPPGSNGSSNQNSPARFKMTKKLVSTRSSPQLLNQIHEEAEDSSGSRTASLSFMEEDPVESFPSSAAGVAVIRRLEARRKLHKARAQSCSSSDASDDDSESKKKRHEKSRTPPYNIPRRRDSQHDDSSDSQEPGMGGATSAAAFRAQQASMPAGTSQDKSGETAAGSRGRNSTSSANANNNNNNANRTVAHLSRRHRSNATSRIRQSHSLNRISELHVVADFSSDHDDISNNNSSCPSSVASVVNGVYYPKPPSLLQHQLISENDSEGGRFDMLTRYLESLSANRSNGSSTIRSRDDSQNSSDGEFDADLATRSSSSRARHKVNLRVLEQRLNKIQEECNKSADEEEGEVDEEMGELSDDVATLPDDSLDPRQDMLDALENARNLQESKDDDQENEHAIVSRTILEIYDPKKYTRRDSDPDETGSTKSCFTTVMSRVSQKPRKPLHRAHSCGSLMGLKERALLSKNLPVIWDILKAANARGTAASQVSSQGEFSLNLAAATNPITTMFQIQSTSRCCNLC